MDSLVDIRRVWIGHAASSVADVGYGSALRISVADGHSVRFLLDSGNGGNWTPGSAPLDTRSLLPVGIDSAAPSCHVGCQGRCAAAKSSAFGQNGQCSHGSARPSVADVNIAHTRSISGE